jgi:ABC-type polysaccharide transport system permease subunit
LGTSKFWLRRNALLVVLVPPSLALQLWAGYPLLNLNGMLSNNFTVQYSTDLSGTNWITLQTFSNLLTSPYQFHDPAGMVASARFCRLWMQ